MPRTLRTAVNLLKTDGFEVLRGKFCRRVRALSERGRYRQWINLYEELKRTDIENIRYVIDDLKVRPLISILMPVYNTEERYLRAAIDSVRAQIYGEWELCIVDDASPDPQTRKILAEYAALDLRIKIALREENGHIAAASNTALTLVKGDFTALMDHDDELSPLALFFVAMEINVYPNANIIYTDEDKIDDRGKRYDPYFKPDWSPDLLMGVNYINHLTVYRTALMRSRGGFRSEFDGSQDYDLLLRVSEGTPTATIRHIPRVLYHWRAVAGSVAYASDEKPYAHDRARSAITEHLERINACATVQRGIGQLHNVSYKLPEPSPKVSIIVHGSGALQNLDKLLESNSALPVEIIKSPLEASREREKLTWAPADNKCAGLNLAAKSASGSILCFLDCGIRDASASWLDALVAYALQPGIGAVGPMLFDARKRISSAGYVLGVRDGVMSAFDGESVKPRGRSIRLDLPQNVSAISLDCLVVAADTFASVGGFDQASLETQGAIDLCLRLRENGFLTVWNPRAQLLQPVRPQVLDQGSLSRLRKKWNRYFEHDPYYNPNLSLDVRKWDLAFPPRLTKY
jgi:O-antigen biosynthesis protein